MQTEGSELVLSLDDKPPDSVLEIDEEDIAKENGVDVVIFRETISERPASMSIQVCLNEFDKRLYKMKSYGTVQSDNILAYRLLKSAHLSNNQEELIKATILELEYHLMKDQLKKTFSDAS